MECFRDIALGRVPRILGLGDRRPGSATFGCFDRYYWHYRLLDFPNLRFQEAALLLGLLWRENFPENVYYAKSRMRAWARAAIEFWLQSRNRDGSVAEAYPFERSFCATSFSTYAITEALLLLGGGVPSSLETTSDWLTRNDNFAVANQMAAAVLALYNCYQLTGIDKYRAASLDKLDKLIKSQHPRGYFPEYGGYDVGYTTVTLSCLAHYYLKTQEHALRPVLENTVAILQNSVREDGSYCVEPTSRQTQFLYPFGFAVMQSDVVGRLINGLNDNGIVNPSWLDDRYVIQLTTNYLQGYLNLYHATDHN